jgi:hypothetical protein
MLCAFRAKKNSALISFLRIFNSHIGHEDTVYYGFSTICSYLLHV